MNIFKNMQLKWKLVWGFALPLVLVVAMSGVIYKSVDHLIQTAEWVNHTHEAIELADNLGGAMVDMETGLRGFLIAGKDEFLEPYVNGQQAFTEVIAKTLNHVSDNPEQVGRLKKIQGLKSKWLNDHAEVAIGMRREVVAGAVATQTFETLSARTIGKENFDGFRAAMAKVDADFVKGDDAAGSVLVHAIIMDMVNQETGQRGFLLSGQEASLEPYVNGRRSMALHADELRALIADAYDREAAVASIEGLETLMARWQKEVAAVGISVRTDVTAGTKSAFDLQQFIDRGTGKQFFDQARVHVTELHNAFSKSSDRLALGMLTNASKQMVDMETGYRGYLLTGDDASLDPFRSGQIGSAKYLSELHKHIARAYVTGTVSKHVEEALELGQNWSAMAAEPEIAARREMNQFTTTVHDVTVFVERGIGKQNMDATRGVLNAFAGAERSLIKVRNADARSTADNAHNITLFGAMLVVLVGVVVTILVTRNVLYQLGADPARVQDMADAVAAGSLNMDLDRQSTGVYAAMVTTVDKLTEVVGSIKDGAAAVQTGADEISQGNANLSQRTEEQASTLEETASSMEEMTSTVKQNADNARQANQLAEGAREQADKGGEVVGQAVGAMAAISESSKKISDIIGVIDEIAFQTNLLALNAAVEAARAGEQGRGFAVVASEVRNLAGRSATAAKEIKSLIQDSGDKVEEGTRLVDESGKTLEEIVSAVKKVTDIVAEIAAASEEQAAGIEQVNKAILGLDETTQQNAALVEEASAAAEAMGSQAQDLNRQVAFFDIGESAGRSSAATPASERRAPDRPFAGDKPKQQTADVMVAAEADAQPQPAPKKVAAGGGADADWEQF